MHRPAPLIHLAEAGHLGSSFVRALPETGRDLDLALERKLRPRLEANSDVRLADGAESARERMLKSRCDELVPDLGRARSQMFQAVIAHRRYSSTVPPVPNPAPDFM